MKFRNSGRIALALAVALGVGFGVTSCSTNFSVGYLYVTASQYNQISGFKIGNNTGQLTPTARQTTGSGGTNPIRALVIPGGRFLFVLNAGCGSNSSPCAAGQAPGTNANISLFLVGGGGALSFQQSYTSQGSAPVSIQTDSTGKFLYVLDSLAPDGSGRGDITAFTIDGNTGRLALITNQQVRDANGTNITYFPVGTNPTDFKIPSSGYIYTIEQGTQGQPDYQSVFVYALNAASGQLTVTQNAPIPTGATRLTYINSGGTKGYVYLLDAGNPPSVPSRILPYTVGANGALQSLVTGPVQQAANLFNPVALTADSKGKFLYVANAGPNPNINSANSSVSGYTIDPTTGVLVLIPTQTVVFGAGSGPRCILEDPSNQYIYTANFNDSTVTGAVLDVNAGVLTPLRQGTSFPTSGNPTWCVASGSTF